MKTYTKTPVKEYTINGVPVLVKREDRASRLPCPPVSKMRGLQTHLKSKKKQGYKIIGYMDTQVSMAGCGISIICNELDMESMLFYPNTKKKQPLFEKHLDVWRENNAHIIPLKPNYQMVNYYRARNILKEYKKDKHYLIDLGMPFDETFTSTKKEAEHVYKTIGEIPKTIVLCVGSGVICGGIIQVFRDKSEIFGISPSIESSNKKIKDMILGKSGMFDSGLLKNVDLHVLDSKYKYLEQPDIEAPFPCHPYYDLKAWEWLVSNVKKLKQPILFWNIGGSY